MNKSEMSLMAIIILILSCFIIYFFSTSAVFNFSDPNFKKGLLMFVFTLGLIGFSVLVGSVTKAFVISFPLIFQFDRKLIYYDDIAPVPAVIQHNGMYITDTVIIIMFIILFNVTKINKLFKFKPVRYYNLFMLVGICTSFWAFNTNASLVYIPTIAMLPVSYYVFTRLFEFNEKNILYFMLGLLGTSFLAILFVWPNYFGLRWFAFLSPGSEDSGSGTGAYSDGNVRAGGIVARAYIALLLAAIIPFMYNFGIYYFRKYRKWIHLGGLILLLTLVLTLNRMHILATCVGIGLIVLYAVIDRVIKMTIVFPFIGIAIILSLMYIVVSSNGNSVESAVARDDIDGRIYQYTAAYTNFTYSNGLGVGMNNFLVSPVTKSVLGSYNYDWNLKTGNTVHDDFMRVLGEYGLFGLIFYILFFSSTFRIKSKSEDTKGLIRGAKINIFVVGMIGLSSPAFNHSYALILIGLYLALINMYKDKTSSEFFS